MRVRKSAEKVLKKAEKVLKSAENALKHAKTRQVCAFLKIPSNSQAFVAQIFFATTLTSGSAILTTIIHMYRGSVGLISAVCTVQVSSIVMKKSVSNLHTLFFIENMNIF